MKILLEKPTVQARRAPWMVFALRKPSDLAATVHEMDSCCITYRIFLEMNRLPELSPHLS